MFYYVATWQHQPSKWIPDSGYGVGHYVAEGDKETRVGVIIGWTRNAEGPMAVLLLDDGSLDERHMSEITVEQKWSNGQ